MSVKARIADGEGSGLEVGVSQYHGLKTAPVGPSLGTDTSTGGYRSLQITEDGRLRVTVGESSSEPINVVITTGTRNYYHLYLINGNEPAYIICTNSEPFNVGGTTLTIAVNGISPAQTCTFPVRPAQPGIHYSSPYPATSNPDTEKLKVSVNGGALTEVKIGKGHTSGDAIAAALQAQIRALVPNGTGVTVQYDTVEYPFRYVFKSGTTGSSSTIHVEKGGDDLASELYVGTAYGGTERSGLNANYYWAYECVALLESTLTDVTSRVENGTQIRIQTVAGGSSASLQVTAGGANTAFGFTTSLVQGVTGSGTNNMNVAGTLASPIRYSISPPISTVFVVGKIEFFIRDSGAALNKFGGLDPLTNGVKMDVVSEALPLIPYFTAKTNADIMTQADEGELIDNGFTSGGQDLVKAVFNFEPGLRIPYGGGSNVYVIIQDNLTELDSFRVRAKGWIESTG